MDPVIIAQLVFAGIKEGMDIYERVQNGDADAIAQAQDWLGVTEEVSEAVENWGASKG